MTEPEKRPKNKKLMSSMATWIVVIAVSIGLSVAVSMLFRGEETYTSTGATETAIKSLVCNATDPENPFFISRIAENYNHEIKVTYRDEMADKIFYVYGGSYVSNNVASTAEATLHADYNKYMGDNEVYQESLYPTFSVVDNKLKISLYTDYKKLNSVAAKLFFIDKEEFHDLNNYSAEELGNFYTEKGFSCEISELKEADEKI